MNTKKTHPGSIPKTTGMILVAMTVLIAASAGASELRNGEPVSLSGSRGEELHFFVEIPDGARFLRYGLEVSSGRIDLYMRLGAPPTLSNYDELQRGERWETYFSYAEVPDPGTWYFMVHGVGAFSGARLQVDYWACEGGCDDGGELRNGVPVTRLTASVLGAVYFVMDTPWSARDIEFSLSGGTGDADLYVRQGRPPLPWSSSPFPSDLNAVACVSDSGNNEETCPFESLSGLSGPSWYVIVFGFDAFSGVTLSARYEYDSPGLDLTEEADLVAPGISESGETYFSLSNHLSIGQNVTVTYYTDIVSTQGFLDVTSVFLGPHQTTTLPLSSAPAGTVMALAYDSDDAARSISGAVLRVDPGNDYATGERAVTREDFCSRQQIRFLDFGSGSEVTILLGLATTFSFRAFDESGTEIASGERPVSGHFNRFPVSDLVGSDYRFGTLVFDFPDGGWVSARYQAFGRFSAEVSGDCTDSFD